MDFNVDKAVIKKILLLFNLVSLLGNDKEESPSQSGRSRIGGRYFFPFDRFKAEKWDIEHIHAVKDKLPQKLDDIEGYFESLAKSYEKQGHSDCSRDIRNFVESVLQSPGVENPFKKAEEFYKSIQEKYSEIDDLHEDNELDNLALLDAKTNRSYKNATFFSKREIIIRRERQGQFVPLCTKNVFLKLHTDNPKDLYRWTEEDREAYVQTIATVLEPYLTEGDSP